MILPVLLEFARILTPNRGPSVSPERLNQLRRDNPLAAMNSSWDPRRLWIVSFREERRRVRIDDHRVDHCTRDGGGAGGGGGTARHRDR